jgi:tetratricopeptide (TPR) repeat protein
VTNLLFHLANTVLWFLFFAWTTGALGPSALVAALFALHPMHVESVAWVSERKDVLSTFFGLATMFAYVRYAAAPGWKRYLPVPILFGLGLLAKPMLITLPLVLLLLDYWPLGRLKAEAPAAARRAGARKPRPPRPRDLYWRLLREKIPLFVLAVGSSVMTLLAQKSAGAMQSLAQIPLDLRVANALAAHVKYLVKLFWPFPMAFFYPLTPVPWWQAVGAALVLLVISALVWRGTPRHPYLAVGWLWFLVTLMPVNGLVQVGGQALADRYTYLPYIGLFIMVSWGAFDLTANWHHRRVWRPLGAGVIISACLLATWLQAGHWRDSEKLINHALQVTEDNYMAYNHLGIHFLNQDRLDPAMDMFQKTVRIKPTYSHAYNNMGVVLAKRGDLDEAVEEFKKALELNPNFPIFRRNLAMAYEQLGMPREAAAVLGKAQ